MKPRRHLVGNEQAGTVAASEHAHSGESILEAAAPAARTLAGRADKITVPVDDVYVVFERALFAVVCVWLRRPVPSQWCLAARSAH